MNLHYLKSFYVTVKHNSISKAARMLHMTQPGLSIQLQTLEKELDASLLIRSNKGVELTEAGKVLFEYASTILSLQDNVEREIKNVTKSKKRLVVGACKAIGEFALPCSIYSFKKEHMDFDIHLEILNTEQVAKELIARNISLGITSGQVPNKELVYKKITSNRLLLTTSIPLIKDKISLDELASLPLIFRERGSGIRKSVLQGLKSHGMDACDLNLVYELNSMEAIKNSVIAGKGISFIPELTIKRELKDGLLKAIEVEGLDLTIDYYLVHAKKNYNSIPESKFESFIMSSRRGFC